MARPLQGSFSFLEGERRFAHSTCNRMHQDLFVFLESRRLDSFSGSLFSLFVVGILRASSLVYGFLHGLPGDRTH